jgi:hypothetical protein
MDGLLPLRVWRCYGTGQSFIRCHKRHNREKCDTALRHATTARPEIAPFAFGRQRLHEDLSKEAP